MTTAFSEITSDSRRHLSNIVYSAVRLAINNCYDLQEIADAFSGGDLEDAFTMCFNEGLERCRSLARQAKEAEQ